MTTERKRRRVVQAWVEVVSEDPEAESALHVARTRLEAGARLQGVRRLRLFELSGPLPGGAACADLLHRSTQFYNPHKERCTVRAGMRQPAPLTPAEQVVLVTERDGTRRPAAERWWRHETGAAIEVREGTAWALTFAADAADAGADAESLARVRDSRHGLFCNPHAQEARVAAGKLPLPWLTAPLRRAGGNR